MADITRTLTTVLRITGSSQYAAGLSQAAQLVNILAVSEQRASASSATFATVQETATTATSGLTAAVTAANPPLLLIAAAFTLIVAEVGLAVEGLKAFSNEAQKLFQFQIVAKNLGINTGGIQNAIGQVSQASTVQRPELLAAAGRFAEAGLNPQQIQQALKTTADTAIAKGQSVEAVARKIERAIEGQTRGLKDYGVSLEATNSRATNFANTMRELDKRFHGAGEAFKSTLPGAIENFQNSLQHLMSVIGERLAPVVITVLNALAKAIDFIADHIDAVLAIATGGLSLLFRFLGPSGNPASKVGTGDGPATEHTQGQILDTLKQTHDSIELAILGGSGAAAKGVFAQMQGRIALAI